MNKLFPAAQAIKLVLGCQARCSSFEFMLHGNSSLPVFDIPCPENCTTKTHKLIKLIKKMPTHKKNDKSINVKKKRKKENYNLDDRTHASSCSEMLFWLLEQVADVDSCNECRRESGLVVR